MSKIKDMCEKYFQESDFYTILCIDKTASDQEVRKAYYKLSMKVHPDRVDKDEKIDATEKFKILSFIYSVLSDKNRRDIYDKTGTIEEQDIFNNSNYDWMSFWKNMFKPISRKEYRDYEVKYKGSDEETLDIKKAYVNGKGSMDYILQNLPFSRCEDEPRIKTVVERLIESGDVKLFDGFFNESPAKVARRKRKYEKEEEEAERVASAEDKEESGEDALRKIIAAHQKERGSMMDGFFDQLAEKYGGAGKKPKAVAGKKPKAVARSNSKKRKRT